VAVSAALVIVASLVLTAGSAQAGPTPVGLGTATAFAVRGGSGVSNVPTSVITGDVGLSPASGSSYTGLACSEVTGTIYAVDVAGPAPCSVGDAGLMTTVENDARTSFNTTSALPGATPTTVDLAGQSLVAGLYSFGGAPTNLSGTLTLDAAADPDSVWIFQASSSLITDTSSTVGFSNLPPGVSAGEMACNVFWTVGSSATLGASSTFVGTILASASISVLADATVTGRLLAANAAGAGGAVTLISDTITRPTGCEQIPAGTGGGPATTTTTAGGGGTTSTTSGTGGPNGPGGPGTGGPGGPGTGAPGGPGTPGTGRPPISGPPGFTG
jgi:hypothetical protein